MGKRTVNWEDIEMYRFKDFYKIENGRRPYRVELKNKEIITVECWINRIKQHIKENQHEYIYETLKDYWTINSNGDEPEFSAYKAYARKDFNNPICAGFKEFKSKGLYINSIGDVYPWLASEQMYKI